MSNKDIITILKEAKELISDPHNWTKQAYARTAKGTQTDPNSPRADCFCISGAVRKVVGLGLPPDYLQDIRHDQYYKAMKTLDAVAESTSFKTANVIAFNDREETSHEDIIKVIDTAIELTIKKEG